MLAAKARTTEDAQPSMRLAPQEKDERRWFVRTAAAGHVQGKRLDHSVVAAREPHLSLSLRDISVGGLSALSQVPLEPGERVAVFFPPEGPRRGWDAYGRILRCEPSAMGYRVAMQFDALPAA